MYRVRRWSVRHSRFLEGLYRGFEAVLVALHPVFRRIGYHRLEKPVATVEKAIKGFLFDSQMCGMCSLSATGMACPMNCPKSMRNGPCGGVRANGNCEVKPDMPCVWVDAYEGSRQMKNGDRILELRPVVDHRLKGTSSWLREARIKAGEPQDMDQAG